MTTQDVLRAIMEDAASDAASLDGQAFTGRAVGETFGKVFASLEALARIMLDSTDPERG